MIMVGLDVLVGYCVNIVMFLFDLVVIVVDVIGVESDVYNCVCFGVLLCLIVNLLDDFNRIVLSEYYDGGLMIGIFMICWDCWKYVYYVGYDLQLFDLKVDLNELYNFVIECLNYLEMFVVLKEGENCLCSICDFEFVNVQCFVD